MDRDLNDQMLPIAFAIVEVELKDSWTWFLTLLIEDLGYNFAMLCTFISNQQKVYNEWNLLLVYLVTLMLISLILICIVGCRD